MKKQQNHNCNTIFYNLLYIIPSSESFASLFRKAIMNDFSTSRIIVGFALVRSTFLLHERDSRETTIPPYILYRHGISSPNLHRPTDLRKNRQHAIQQNSPYFEKNDPTKKNLSFVYNRLHIMRFVLFNNHTNQLISAHDLISCNSK